MTGLHGSVGLLVPFVLVVEFAVLDFGFGLFFLFGLCIVAIPYLKNPSLDPQFRIYFSKEWYEGLRLSVRNFFNEIFNGTHILLSRITMMICFLKYSFSLLLLPIYRAFHIKMMHFEIWCYLAGPCFTA